MLLSWRFKVLQILSREFYERSPDLVARDLLGKRLIRRLDGERIECIIVETEAYFGERDPASRAFKGKKKHNVMMWDQPGRLFIYNVHKYWMTNVIAHEKGDVGGVLIRAVEPKKGIELLRVHRGVNIDRELTNGPGKLSVALCITPDMNGCPVTEQGGPLEIWDAPDVKEYCRSRRIGVTRDLDEELRFFIKDNRFVSR